MRIIEVPLHLKESFLQLSADSLPPVAPANFARLCYDRAAGVLKFSVNGGAFSSSPSGGAAPPASATQASLLLDSGTGGTAFNGSANGTVLGINGTTTADLINAQKNGAARFSVTETGIMTALKAIIGGTTADGTATITATDTNTIGLIVRPAVASPTANYFAIQNSTGSQTHVTYGGGSPFLGISNASFGFFYNGQISTTHRVGVTSDAAASIPLATRGIAGQTGNLFQALLPGTTTPHVFIGSLVAVADATLTLRAITSQTGFLLSGRNAGNTADVFKVLPDGRGVFAAPASAIADASLHNSSFSWYLDAGENNIIVKVKLAAGTIKTATIAIA